MDGEGVAALKGGRGCNGVDKLVVGGGWKLRICWGRGVRREWSFWYVRSMYVHICRYYVCTE